MRKYIGNESNLTTNIRERDFINILKEEYSKILNGSIETIYIEKCLYIKNIGQQIFSFEMNKFEFLNLRLLKGKTKKHLRVKLNKISEKQRSLTKQSILINKGDIK